jgi:hypothetical protein
MKDMEGYKKEQEVKAKTLEEGLRSMIQSANEMRSRLNVLESNIDKQAGALEAIKQVVKELSEDKPI